MVRTDIPLADQIVQVGHACLAAGARFGQVAAAGHLVVLAVTSSDRLYEALARLDLAGIPYVTFFEPDNDLGYTAACTAPLGNNNARQPLRRYRLWSSQ